MEEEKQDLKAFYAPYIPIISHVNVNGVRCKVLEGESIMDTSKRIQEGNFTFSERIYNSKIYQNFRYAKASIRDWIYGRKSW